MAPQRRSRLAYRKSVSRTDIRNMIRSSQLFNEELKYFINTQVPSVSVVAGTVVNISNSIIAGTEINQRIGRKIEIRKINWRYSITLPVAAIAGSIRMIMFHDGHNTGTTTGVLELLSSATVTAEYSATFALSNRFKILHDVTHPMVVGGADQQIHVDKHFTKTVRKMVYYNGSTAVSASNGRDAIFVLVVTDLLLNSPIYAWDVGIRYVDA